MWRRWLAVLAIASALVAGIFWLELASHLPIHQQHQNQANTEHRSSQTKDRDGESFWQATVNKPEAFFAACVAIFTAVLALSTGGLWLATLRLWRVSERHAGHMEESVKVARESSAIAKQSADAAALHARAAVGIEIPTIFVTDVILRERGVSDLAGRLQFASIEVAFKNFGRTPAFLVQESVNVKVDMTLPETPIYYVVSEYSPGSIIEHGKTETRRYDNVTGYDERTVADILAGNKFLWVYGFLIYQDFLRTFHEIGFCARFFGPYRSSPGRFAFGYGPPKYTYAREREGVPLRMNPNLPPFAEPPES